MLKCSLIDLASSSSASVFGSSFVRCWRIRCNWRVTKEPKHSAKRCVRSLWFCARLWQLRGISSVVFCSVVAFSRFVRRNATQPSVCLAVPWCELLMCVGVRYFCLMTVRLLHFMFCLSAHLAFTVTTVVETLVFASQLSLNKSHWFNLFRWNHEGIRFNISIF